MRYTTFCKSLDELFGGYRIRRLFHVYGDAKTGKTTLSFYLPSISIYKTHRDDLKTRGGKFFVLICTDGGYEEERHAELAEIYEVSWKELEDKILVYEPLTLEDQTRVITVDLRNKIALGEIKPKLITLDTATILYREKWRDIPKDRILETARRYKPQLSAQMQDLLRFARYRHAISIATNIRRAFLGFSEEERARVYDFYGGWEFAYLPYCCLRLQRIEKYGDIIEVTRVYHRTSSSKVINVRLTEKGFEDIKTKRGRRKKEGV